MDKMTIEILPDGTIKTTTNAFSAANHGSAEAFLRTVLTAAGGTGRRTAHVNRSLRGALEAHAADGHTHDNEHTHAHS